MKINQLGEFGLIGRIRDKVAAAPGVIGIGDDCAIVPQSDFVQLFTTDLLVEDIHFLRAHIPPRALGHKALAVNLSDIAAMGGTPQYTLLSLALPRDLETGWLDEFVAGFDALARNTNTYLIGGDTTRTGKITISVTLIGNVQKDIVKLRSSAKPKDIICVTGNLGDSKAGLDCILNARTENDLTRALIDRHYWPQPHLAEGIFLAEYPAVHAMMDLSDGLAGDIKHIMAQSQCGAAIDLGKLPKSKELQDYAKTHSLSTDEFAYAGGEDYCLLVTIDPDHFHSVAQDFEKKFSRPLHEIGTMMENDFQLTCNGDPATLNLTGFDHFG